jgi:pSer/pThr/pTyr-binding forkhead associated (FHA) protein
MQPAQITLTGIRGTFAYRRFVFQEFSRCIIGRASDCTIQVPVNRDQRKDNVDVSRHHCLLEIDPPVVRVRDLGSLNGTYVNGRKIGQRPRSLLPDAIDIRGLEPRDLHDGDELQVGDSSFRVGIVDPCELVQPAVV